MKQSWLKLFFALILAATLSAPAWGANPAQPGTINYVEGQVLINSLPLDTNSVGSVTLLEGQTVSTQNGRAEILLTPGVFLRIDDNSSAVLVSARLTNIDLRLTKGRAAVEVAAIHKENKIRIDEGDSTVTLRKAGLYSFDADHGQVEVVKGEAVVGRGSQQIKLSDHRMLNVGNPNDKPAKVNEDSYKQDDFFQWSSLRSEYLAEANTDAAQVYTSGLPGTGWYWDPWFDSYTFIPGDGIFYSPFGWGFYSPTLFVGSPFFFGFGGHFQHHFVSGLGFRERGPFVAGFQGRRLDGFHDRGFNGRPGFHRGFQGHPAFNSGGFRGRTGFHQSNGFHSGAGFHGAGGHGR